MGARSPVSEARLSKLPPPHPPAAAAAVVARARRMSTASNVNGTAVSFSAQTMAPAPGPTAAVGSAMVARVIAVITVTNPPSASRTPGEACHFFAR